MPYLPIADYAVIGDLRTAALVGRNGSIDWCCVPRFDAPAVFGALLDDVRGGRCRIAPVAHWTSEQRYLPATNVLETAFHVDGGVLQVIDFMPVGPARGRWTEIYRRVHCPRGSVEFEVLFEPRFDYGVQVPALVRRASGILATDQEDDVATITSAADVPWSIADGRATARLRLDGGSTLWFVVRFDDDEVLPLTAHEPDRKLETTTQCWDDWASRLRYQGPYHLEVQRSALALKLCCYEPSGAIVAAPTTSLPEAFGGARNWDYRFSWLRDSAFVLYSLDRFGYEAETKGFFDFLKRVCRRADPQHLQIMFTIDGHRDLPERALDHLEGYRGTRPVRVGNDAVRQFQLDVYGELLETMNIWRRRNPISEGLWKVARDLVDSTASYWRRPDYSIWEPRYEPKHHVFSKVMAWVALDRGIRIARTLRLAGDHERWEREANALRAEVLERGWDSERRTFLQAYGEPQLDASMLVVPLVGFLPRSDPRVRSTLEAIRRELATSCEELIYRYRAPDGLGGGEGAFLFCSFWMVQNLALVGQHAEAERLFRNLLRRTNHVGLLAEEIDPATGEQLGNFPQALSHAALLNAASTLEQLRPREEADVPLAEEAVEREARAPDRAA
ncbi:MAG: glycoside hydrolase family 15 protein [Gemmatimonadetes bacterium]|nr:glycoside hydrolase family 15 protein [Gemmatimonadota bacterium]